MIFSAAEKLRSAESISNRTVSPRPRLAVRAWTSPCEKVVRKRVFSDFRIPLETEIKTRDERKPISTRTTSSSTRVKPAASERHIIDAEDRKEHGEDDPSDDKPHDDYGERLNKGEIDLGVVLDPGVQIVCDLEEHGVHGPGLFSDGDEVYDERRIDPAAFHESAKALALAHPLVDLVEAFPDYGVGDHLAGQGDALQDRDPALQKRAEGPAEASQLDAQDHGAGKRDSQYEPVPARLSVPCLQKRGEGDKTRASGQNEDPPPAFGKVAERDDHLGGKGHGLVEVFEDLAEFGDHKGDEDKDGEDTYDGKDARIDGGCDNEVPNLAGSLEKTAEA